MVSREQVVEFLKALLPDIDWLLDRMEKDGGWLRLSSKAVDYLTALNISKYPELYVDEKKILGLLAVAVAGEGDKAREFVREVGEEYEKNPGAFVKETIEAVTGVNVEIEKVFALTHAERGEAKAAFEKLPEEERHAAIRKLQLQVSFLVVMFFQTLAVMVHGRKMTALVASAIEGDDDALCKAVQIDRSVLVAIPYFGERLRRAHLEGDGDFCGRLGYRMANPVLKGKIRYRTLWIVFSFLEQFGLLDGALKHREILDICEQVGVGGKKSRIEDVGYLSKRLAEYRRFQKKGGRTTH